MLYLLRIVVPSWLRRMLRPAPIPVDWSRVGVAALGIAGPQAVGLASGRIAETILLSLGALCISFSDLTSSYRYRLRRVGLTVVLGGFGFGVGVLAPGPWTAACVVVTVSVLSVLASRLGDLWAAAGTQMLTFCIVATGTPTESMGAGAQFWWFLAGEIMAFGLIAATWPFRRTAPARQAVARVFDTTVRMLTAETPRARTDARQALTKALDDAHDVLIGVTAGATARSRVHDRLHVVLSQATPMVEASVALAHAGSRPPEHTLTTMRTLARCVRSGTIPPPSHPTAHETSTAVRALEQALAGLIDSLRTAKLTDPTELVNNRDRRARFRVWREGLAIGRTGWLLASRMAVCLAVAELVGLALPLEQPYWVALTVALVLKPNSGSVFARGVLRGIGSVLGVVVATALLTFVPHGWWLLPFMVLLAAMVPDALSRHYGLFTGVVTCLVLLKMTQVEPTPALPAVRLVDSLIGCAILLVVGGLLSPLHRHTPLAPRFASAVDTVSEYVSLALGGFEQGRSAARRRSYRELSELRAALRQRLVEPTSANNAEKWWTSIIVLERLVDGATARAIHIERGDEAFSLQHTQRIVSSMRSTARQLREVASGGAVEPPADLPGRLAELGAEISRRHPEPPSHRREDFETAGR
ncbi:FUSC family protein [Actinopolyspora erythraea]|nr:FUSC family protein [Actinopolyspora erythraea]